MLHGLIEGLIGAVIGFAFLPVLISAIEGANLTGTLLAIANLVPVLYIIVIIVGLVVYVKLRNK